MTPKTRASRRVRFLLPLLALLGCSSPTSSSDTPAVHSSATPAVAASPSSDPSLPQLAPDPRESVLAKNVAALLSEEHLTQKPLDDTISRAAFPAYLEQLDGAKLFLLKEHVTLLERDADKMDDQIRAGDLALARKGGALLAKRREVVAKVVAGILAKPFDLDEVEELETDAEKRAYAATEDELADRWRRVLKLQVLERIDQLEQIEAGTTKKPEPGDPLPPKLGDIPKTLEGKEEKARNELALRFETRFTRWATLEPLEPATFFLNAIASVYDPHTVYLAPAEKENFDIQITGTLEGIGAALGEQDHYIVVRELIPGGAAWKQGKLEAGDLILSVAQDGAVAVDITDMPIDKVVKMIRGPKGTLVNLTVKKVDGRVESLAIKRDVVEIEASYARGAVLDLGKNHDPMGYVYLPGFYGDTRGTSKSPERNATDDVKKLLETFQAKKLGGVILDLRGNGGGLLDHASQITGLFIDSGPVVQAHGSDKRLRVLEDKDPAVAFTGEVVVLVDRFSASASEILAGALQDYGRAVVVGTGATHGKGTVQAIVDLDELKSGPGDSHGVLKLTIQQYFRVGGESTQSRGVLPDVLLPDPVAYVDGGERKLPHAVPWSAIDPLKFRTYHHAWDSATLYAESKKRVAAQPLFQKVEAFSTAVKARRDQTVVPLQREQFLARRKKNKSDLDALDPKMSEEKPRIEVTPIELAVAKTNGKDKDVKSRLDKWREDLARDIWVEESLRVLEDMKKAR